MYYWIEGNCCYNKHHVEQNKFYVMETDNECYREFLVEEELLATAMSEANTLAFHAFAMEIRTLHEMNQLYMVRNMWKNFIKIGKQIYLPEKI